jgi:hypothetical protein
MDPYTQLSKKQKRWRVQKGLLEANADVIHHPLISQGGVVELYQWMPMNNC